MNSLGIYFGPKLITVAESKGRRLIKSVQIPQPVISAGDLEGKVPPEVKLVQLVALFKDELRKNQIEAKKAALCLSGKDLIIRTFDIPVLPRGELKSAVNFEAKKYIPFKGEDLISDFQIEFDPASRINQVLFVAVKKQTLDRYVSLAEQLGIQISGIEYSAFSLLKFLKLSSIRDNGTVALICADLRGEDEANFLVLKDGFPLFSRDFAMLTAEFFAKGEKAVDSGMVLEKFKTEVRVSLDYFHRKFSDKSIQRIVLISNSDYRPDLEGFMKEINLSAQFVDFAKINKALGKVSFNLDLMKSFSSSLAGIRTKLKLNLLAARVKPEDLDRGPSFDERIADLFVDLKIDYRVIAAAVLICLITFIWGLFRTIPFRKELDEARSRRPKAVSVDTSLAFNELSGIQSRYKDKLKTLDRLVKNQLYLTEALDAVPRIIPGGVWLAGFNYNYQESAGKRELTLQGISYLGDRDKELAAVDDFLFGLNNNPNFKKFFKDIKIVSVDRRNIGDTEVTNFVIACKG